MRLHENHHNLTAKPQQFLTIENSRVHNLKELSVSIPRNKLVVITGISGSGKSSLAFDTIYAEGRRRYMESFSAYARQFVGGFERPDVDKVSGLSPVISIEQKTVSKNPRSTVGTITEIYDFMRLLYARTATAYSYHTGKPMVKFSEQQILNHIIQSFDQQKITILAPVVRGRKGHYRELFAQIKKQGYLKVRVDGDILDISPAPKLDRYKTHNIEIVIDRLQVNSEADQQRLIKSIQAAFQQHGDLVMVLPYQSNEPKLYSKSLMCVDTGISYEEPSPNTFSFNSPYGACPRCKGLGTVKEVNQLLIIPDPSKTIRQEGLLPAGKVKKTQTFKQLQSIADAYHFDFDTPLGEISPEAMEVLMHGSGEQTFPVKLGLTNKVYQLSFDGLVTMINNAFDSTSIKLKRWAEKFMTKSNCPACDGKRLKQESLHFKLYGKAIHELTELTIDHLHHFVIDLEQNLDARTLEIARDVLKEIKERLGFLNDVGLGYLSLERPTRTLSGGESQRIRLASQIGSKLRGITYILDEPSIGLHQRDNTNLVQALKNLRDLGNTVLVVEHDKDIMLESDYIIDIGPAAGKHGGEVVAQGSPEDFLKTNTLTALYLNNRVAIEVPDQRREGNGKHIVINGASGNNLQHITATFPLGKLICVSGVSGSGKSTLVNETLYPILNKHIFRAIKEPLAYESIQGLEHIDKVIEIDQSPIGRTPRSNPATYSGVYTDIRKLFSDLPEAKIRGYEPGRFSFNVKGGRCEMCQGAGLKTIEMNFLPDVHVECEACLGQRFNRETLEVRYKGKSIGDVLNMTINEAAVFFEPIPSIYRKIKTLQEVGLGYITLGQNSVTLSGGEAQRVKLASELQKKDTGQTFYILDEPTTGLHFEDIRQLLTIIDRLVGKGNTVLIIEHNLDVIKVADYIIDIGLEGGSGGGKIIAEGTPEEVAKHSSSYTAKYLKLELG